MLYNYLSAQDIWYILQILLAIVLGAILGVQRERWGKWAGPRTYALVCAGSALFTLLSRNFFTNNPAVIAGSIVTGIGFLGAGTILHKENRVEGLTTAAGLWMAAAIGMTVGVERYILASITTLIILLVLMIDDKSIHKEH
jgi:putative Mg2+ transporter-C (MgtC) family protein